MAQPQDKPPESSPVTSSEPQILTSEQEALYREVLLSLEQHRIPYAVSGAFALREYTGICRITKDLDVFLTAENSARALVRLREEGFTCEVCDPVWLAKAHRDGYFVDLITGMSNAVVVVDHSWIERSRPATIVGIATRVLAPEELLASKLFVTRRERFDGADIAHIIYGTQGNIEWDRVLQLIGEHWEILLWALLFFRYSYPAQTSFVPAALWRGLLDRFASEIAGDYRHAPFRGSLLDDNMFSIDFKEWGLENILEDYRAKRIAQIENSARRCA
jgi:Nucleotidyl transferase of unknown function (DUF2204)